MDGPNILVTNDDGVESTGLDALCDALSSVGNVTMVAPNEDHSAVGRTLSHSVTVREHERGYVVDGTPADCTVVGLSTLCPDTDIVVAGCNRGANLGAGTLGRSGTVSAAVEAVFFDVPAIAVSMYIPNDAYDPETLELNTAMFSSAVDAAAYLVEHTDETGLFDGVDYLNLNAPIAEESTGEMTLTHPSPVYRLDSTRDGSEIALEDHIWELMADDDIPDAEGTDRRAVLDGFISVSPLTASHSVAGNAELDTLVDDYTDGRM